MAEPYAEDCLHLKACRRFSLLLKKNGIIRARGCDPNYCTAYESKDEYYTREQVEAVKHGVGQL